MTDGRVALSVTALGGQQLAAPLPDVHLRNLGGKGKSPAEAAAQDLQRDHGRGAGRGLEHRRQGHRSWVGAAASAALSALGSFFKKGGK